ncbi:Fur family transcriptional regulator [Desulfuribacillus stibiiarsenatis]|nr:transcriptional repressor [Desulfuribacillus stibiiarsenatis]
MAALAMFCENIAGKLSNGGFRMTPQRRVVIEIMVMNHDKHLTVDEIYELVKEKSEDIGLATVYRTLSMLMKLGVVSKIILDDIRNYYEIKLSKYDHYHLVCKKCGRVIEGKNILKKYVEEIVKKEHDFMIVDKKIVFYGLCASC